jgi:hypothetical protein
LNIAANFLAIFSLTFANTILFGLALIAFALPSLYFSYHLYDRKITASLSSKASPMLLVRLVDLMLWFFLGALMFQSSLWANDRLWSYWIQRWQGARANGEEMNESEDERLLISMRARLSLETIPILGIVVLNYYLSSSKSSGGSLSTIALIAVILAVASIINYFIYMYVYASRAAALGKGAKKGKRLMMKIPTASSLDHTLRSMSSSFYRHPASVQKKRHVQAKKVWDMLMMISDRYPELFRVLAAEHILSAADLVNHLSIRTRNKIVYAIPAGALRDHVFNVLANFVSFEEDGFAAERAGKPAMTISPIIHDDIDANETKNSETSSQWEMEFDMEIDEFVSDEDERQTHHIHIRGNGEASENFLLQDIYPSHADEDNQVADGEADDFGMMVADFELDLADIYQENDPMANSDGSSNHAPEIQLEEIYVDQDDDQVAVDVDMDSDLSSLASNAMLDAPTATSKARGEL